MAPKLLSDDRRHIVIRPLAYVCERDIARYSRSRAFPIIPCRLCGSQENLQRGAVKKMLREWELLHPGRTDTIFAALRTVEPEHLADPRWHDFAGLDQLRVAAMTDAEEDSLAAARGLTEQDELAGNRAAAEPHERSPARAAAE
jgi:tRNA 2-thiocytidine biosynthesis protein TtcA